MFRGQGTFVCFLDVDPIEIEKTKRRLAERGFAEDILSIKQMNFANVKKRTAPGVRKV